MYMASGQTNLPAIGRVVPPVSRHASRVKETKLDSLDAPVKAFAEGATQLRIVAMSATAVANPPTPARPRRFRLPVAARDAPAIGVSPLRQMTNRQACCQVSAED